MQQHSHRRQRLKILPVRVHPFHKGFRIGSIIEVRPRNEDELFYTAIIVQRITELSPRFRTTFTVQYEDGDIEDGILRSSMIRPFRRLVYNGNDTIVEEGAILVNGIIRRVRLLHFRQSIGIYQSGLLMSSLLVNIPDYSILPFEVNQTMLLGLALFAGLNRGKLPQRMCFVGLGGGAVPSCIVKHVYEERGFEEATVVDLSLEVIDVAKAHFGLPSSIKVVCEDAFDFLQNCGSFNYDLIVLDVSDASDRFLPPLELLNPDLLRMPFSDPISTRSERKSNSILVMNVLPERDSAPFHAEIAAQALSQAFPASYCAAGDPNHVLFGLNLQKSNNVDIQPHEVLEWVGLVPRLQEMIPGVMRDLRDKPQMFWKRTNRLLSPADRLAEIST